MWYERVKYKLGESNPFQTEQSEAKQPLNPEGKLKKNQSQYTAWVGFVVVLRYTKISDFDIETYI